MCQLHIVVGWVRLFKRIDVNAFYNAAIREETAENLSQQHEEMLRRIMDWLQCSQVPEHIFWVHKSPSSIPQSIASLHQQTQSPLATYFIDKNPDNDDVRTRFVSTVAYQLGLYFSRARKEIAQAVEHNPALLSLSVSHQLESLILKPFSLHLVGF